MQTFYYKKTAIQGLPCGPEVKNPPCNAEDMGSIPGWETINKVPCSSGQLSLSTAREKPVHPNDSQKTTTKTAIYSSR